VRRKFLSPPAVDDYPEHIDDVAGGTANFKTVIQAVPVGSKGIRQEDLDILPPMPISSVSRSQHPCSVSVYITTS